MRHLLPLVLLLTSTAVVQAQVNLIQNSSFDDQLDGYIVDPAGSWSIDPAEGSMAGSGAPSASCTETDPDVCTISQCVSLAGNTGQTLHNWSYASRNASNVATISTAVTFYASADCTGVGIVRDFASLFFPPATWIVDNRMVMAEAGELSALVTLTFSAAFDSGNTFTVKLDDFTFLGNPVPPFFFDDFESGTADAWSSTVPD